MNKYQEALDRALSWVPSNFGWSDFDVVGTLQELVDKETPMKPIRENELYVCSNCGEGGLFYSSVDKKVIFKESFCSSCGQKIDWSDVSA